MRLCGAGFACQSSAQLLRGPVVYILMRKVLLIFLGLVLLAQSYKIWERGHHAACVKRSSPTGVHSAHPQGGNIPSPKVMLA